MKIYQKKNGDKFIDNNNCFTNAQNNINLCKQDNFKSNDYLFNQNNFHSINSDLNYYNNNYFINSNNKYYNFNYLLKTNPNIASYIYLFDYLDLNELHQLFSFILNNIDNIISNPQSFLLIDKIISLLNCNSFNEDKESKNNINESICYFLKSFFNKRIISLINYNNYISCIVNLVIKLKYPKNDFIYIEIKDGFISYAYNRQ